MTMPVLRHTAFACAAVASSVSMAQTPPGLDEAQASLSEVTITETRERAYRSTVAPTANKSDTALKETPFSFQTVTRELIEDRGVTTFGEAVRTVPGLTPQVGWGGSNDRFRLRGFATSSNLKNGFRRSVFAPVDELANIEQIEVLKGPASALYGRFEPGGVVNLVTKKPLPQAMTRFELSAGSHDFRRATVDSTGPISDTLSYRLNAAWEDQGSFRDFVDSNTQFLAPVFQWKLSPQTTLTAELELLRKKGAFDRGFGNSPLFLGVPISTSYGERDARFVNESTAASLTIAHRFNDRWSFHGGLQASRAKTDATFYAFGFPALSGAAGADPIVNRRKQRNFDDQTDYSAMAEVAGAWDMGGLRHRVLLGADYSFDDWDFTGNANVGAFGFPTNLPLSLYNPVHGAPAGPLSHYDSSRYKGRSLGLYAQDEMTLSPQWRLLVGARYDHVKSNARAEYLPVTGSIDRSDAAVSPRIGLTWTPVPAVSIYASHARSFLTEPFSGMLSDGQLPRPSRGKQTEIGSKLSLLEGRLEPTLALFDIRRTNGIVSDPADPNYVIQVGEQRSRGWELDLPLSLTPQWRLIASYTALKATVSEDTDASLVGKTLANAPRRNASLWTSYDFRGNAAGLSIGAGVHHVGQRQANNANSFVLPAYTRWDANLSYRFGHAQRYRVQLNVQNLTDKRYYDSGGSFVPTYPGAPRKVTATFGMTL